MTRLAFFRLLCSLGAGGLATLALTSGHAVSRGFFRFGAGLFALCAATGLAVALLSGRGADPRSARAIGALGASAALAALYALVVSAIGTERGRVLLGVAAVLGIAGVSLEAALPLGTALAHPMPASASAPAALAVPLAVAAALASALLLGSVLTAMILGHWYLVMPALPPDPLLRVVRLYAAAVVARIAVVVVAAGALVLAADGRALDRFLDGAGLLLWPRLLFGLAGPLILALMALPTVRARDTQPATGMLYVASVLVLVGEGVAHYLRIRTGVPT